MIPATTCPVQHPPFHVFDLNAQGELQLSAKYSYEDLELLPGTADLIGLFSGRLYANPGEWQTSLSPTSLKLRFFPTSSTSALATLSERDKTLSLSVLLTGINKDSDQLTISSVQSHLLRELHGTPFEPSFSLLNLQERPMVASIHLALPENPDARALFAIADRCLAAAYLRFNRLA